MKVLLLLTALLQISVRGKNNRCATPDEFENQHKAQFDLYFEKAGYTVDENKRLHDTLFDNGIYLGTGNNGVFKELKNFEPRTVIKKVTLNNEQNITNLREELSMTRRVCRNKDDDFSIMLECNSQAISSFYGCVEVDNTFYIFLEYMAKSLGSEAAKLQLEKFSIVQKLQIMLDLVDNVRELHKIDIVHSDLRLEKIWTNDEGLNNLKILDLPFANKVNGPLLAEENLQRAPELYQKDIVDLKNDIFSLGLVFAQLLGGFDNAIKIIEGNCFEKSDNRTECKNKINKELDNVFAKVTNADLKKLLQDMLELDPKERIQNIEQVCDGLLKILPSSKEGLDLIQSIKSSAQLYAVDGQKPSYWRRMIIPISNEVKPNPEPNGTANTGKPIFWVFKPPVTESPGKKNQNIV